MFVSGPHVAQTCCEAKKGLNFCLYLLSTGVTGEHHDRPVDVWGGRGNGLCVRLTLYLLSYSPRHLSGCILTKHLFQIPVGVNCHGGCGRR